jgi:DNA-binding NarL/FixJ family response regulator
MKKEEKHIILADSHYLSQRSMQLLLAENFQPCSITLAEDRQELERLLAPSVALVIVEPDLADLGGTSALQQLRTRVPGVPFLVLAAALNRAELNQLNQAGIRNILFKTATFHELIEAAEAALKGQKYYGQEVMELLMDAGDTRKLPLENTSLTGSEIEIIRLIAEGLTTKEIALRKYISFHTVMTHRKNIFRKAGVNNASELVMFAIRNGIVDSIDYQI